eukprot:gnl/Trimastix_PCT/2266.p1 GENE.gnl/Trimastix_PCT/2266~~gnl/Trimastix_PCT/2266.p1  ORF type:complete len:598 (-),score=173.33 gnl/Trimastix_PCT/2266:563-2356(-)
MSNDAELSQLFSRCTNAQFDLAASLGRCTCNDDVSNLIRNLIRVSCRRITELEKEVADFKSKSDAGSYRIANTAAVFSGPGGANTRANFRPKRSLADARSESSAHILPRRAISRAPSLNMISPTAQTLNKMMNGFERNNLHHTQPLHYRVNDILKLCAEATAIFKHEDKLLDLSGPTYVFGDTHGNYRDLMFYMNTFAPTGRLDFTPHSMLFLGDYVDRGEYSVEVITRLLVAKIVNPRRLFLLRGNHEIEDINGDVEVYGDGSFRAQCHRCFGPANGERVWRAFNDTFEHLPLAAVIDNQLFCVHGGFPRPHDWVETDEDDHFDLDENPFAPPADEPPRAAPLPPRSGSVRVVTMTTEERKQKQLNSQRLNQIRSLPARLHVSDCHFRAVLVDLLWSDPAPAAMPVDQWGFCPSDRGPQPDGPLMLMWGQPAVDQFLEETGFTIILRGHESKSSGFQTQKNDKVITLFSATDYVDMGNAGACVLCDHNAIRFVVREATTGFPMSTYAPPPPPEDDDGGDTEPEVELDIDESASRPPIVPPASPTQGIAQPLGTVSITDLPAGQAQPGTVFSQVIPIPQSSVFGKVRQGKKVGLKRK